MEFSTFSSKGRLGFKRAIVVCLFRKMFPYLLTSLSLCFFAAASWLVFAHRYEELSHIRWTTGEGNSREVRLLIVERYRGIFEIHFGWSNFQFANKRIDSRLFMQTPLDFGPIYSIKAYDSQPHFYSARILSLGTWSGSCVYWATIAREYLILAPSWIKESHHEVGVNLTANLMWSAGLFLLGTQILYSWRIARMSRWRGFIVQSSTS
jgi:hypothetical protein